MVEIDKHKIYESRGYRFKNFIILNDEEKRMVLKWRNADSVRRRMYSANQATEEEHFNYIKTLEGRDDRWYWLVYRDDLPVGVFVLALKDRENEMYEGGSYLNPELYGEGFDFFKEINYFLYFVIGIQQMCGTVQADNKEALYINMFLGGKYTEKKIIPQDGKDVEYLVCPICTKEDFEPHKDATLLEYARFVKKMKELEKTDLA